MFQDGQTFGDFEILGRLGEGGSGTLYKAREVPADRIVALKILKGAPATAPEVVARFCRDAQIAVSLDHPDLALAYATGETDGVHWVAMEFVEGTNAQARLRRKGRLALPEAVAIGTHVATALNYGWRKAQIIHGDVEPDTILLSKKSEVKLAGLGFGHALGEMRPLAAEGVPSGAAHYVSPERAEGKKDADLRADIYSLGCTLFHLISGEPPYGGDTALAVVLHHVTMPVPDLRAMRPECPAEVARVVMKMMHKMPGGRHQNYDELIEDLRLCYEAITNPTAVATASPAAPRPERIHAPVPLAAPAPAREVIRVAPVPVAKLEPSQHVPPAGRVNLLSETDPPEDVEAGPRRRSFAKPLAIGGGALLAVVVAIVAFRPGKDDGQLSEAQRASLERAARKYEGDGSIQPLPKPVAPKATATPEPPKIVAAETPAPTPAPAPAPMPEPAPVAQQSVTAKWLAEQEPQWQAAFASEVSGPFEKGVADLKSRYLVTVERELATLPPTAGRAASEPFRAERARITGGGTVPAEDESMAPAPLRAMRANYRTALAKLDADRLAKARAVHARYEAVMAQAQAGLAKQQRTGEAQELQAKRESLREAWLTPPAGSPPAIADAPGAAPAPVPQKPAPAAPPGPKLPKLAPRDLVERLLAMGATISIGRPGAFTRVDKMADLPGEKFAVAKVEFIPHEGMSGTDLDIVEQLTDVEEMEFTSVPVTDATLKLLRNLPALHKLALRDLGNVTAAGYRTIAALPSLKTLGVRGPVGAESLSAFTANRKLDSLSLNDVIFVEQDFAAIAGIPVLKTLTISTRDAVVPGAWARLVAAKKLTTLNLEKTPKTAEMIAQIGRIAHLTSISLGDVTLPDSDLAPLGALKFLQTLRTTSGSTVDGNVFATWLPHPAMKTLTFPSTRSVTDKVLRAIATAFPMLDHLEVRAEAGSVTAAGLAHLQKLRKLDHLALTGDAVDSAGLAHIVTLDQIIHLGLGSARLAEEDARLFAKLGSLRELELNNPPVSDAALKGYAKLRGLMQFKIGSKTKPEVMDKLVIALPTVKVIP